MNRRFMTQEQIEHELQTNEAVFVMRPLMMTVCKVVLTVASPFLSMDQLESLAMWFAKRSHYLKVGKLHYGWRDFDCVNEIYKQQLEGNYGE